MKTLKLKTFTYKVELEQHPTNPREWDNAGTMICFHNRYTLGDEHSYKESDFASWLEILEKLKYEYGDIIILPLYLYEHSSISMKTTPFGDRFDSGQVGFIFAKKGTEDLNDEELEETLISEVRNYSNYISGSVYEYQVIDQDGEIVDGCGGYGDENLAEADAKESLENEIKMAEKQNQEIKEKIARIEAIITKEVEAEKPELLALLTETYNNLN
jgi:hypothetical protein